MDDSDEIANWESTLVRCYSRMHGDRIPLKEVADRARQGNIDWGIKGTRHVALVSSELDTYIEVELERVTPRVEWGIWKTRDALE